MIENEFQLQRAHEFLDKGKELVSIFPEHEQDIRHISNQVLEDIDEYEAKRDKAYNRAEDDLRTVMNRVNLGDRVRDTITGFTGIVVSRCEYLYGCIRCAVEHEGLDKDGNQSSLLPVFDEQRLEVMDEAVFPSDDAQTEEAAAQPGGPHEYPAERQYPSR